MSCRVFYVDDQEDIVWSTTKLMARKCPELEVEGFTDPAAALAALQKHPPDIMVTDLRMEEMSGLELLVEARKVVPDLPVILVTAYGGPDVTAALQGRSLVDYLEKPVRTETLVASIERLLTRSEGFSGAISLPMLPDLIQVYTLTRTTGALSIRRGGSSGTIWFEDGSIVHASCDERRGETAVYELLSWQGGEFSLDTRAVPPERTITASWQEVLLEGCRLLDEAGREDVAGAEPEDLDEARPSTQVAVPADLLPEEPEAEPPVSQPTAEVADTAEVRRSSANLDEWLSQLAEVDGFLGAAVFSGSIVYKAAFNGSGFDLQGAVLDNAQVLEAIYGTVSGLHLDDIVDDVVVTLSQQYHLIRPVSRRPGMFFYLVLDRSHGNLISARKQLATLEQQIES